MEQDLSRELREINKSLANIERLLRKMPEIQAAVFLQMQEEARLAEWNHIKLKDLWNVCPPAER